MTNEAEQLLKQASLDPDGRIKRFGDGAQMKIQTNLKDFLAPNSPPQSRALWIAVIEELCGDGFIEEKGGKGMFFDVTHKGYVAAKALPDSSGIITKVDHE